MERKWAYGANRANGTRANKANGTNKVRHYETLVYYTRARVRWRMREREKERLKALRA